MRPSARRPDELRPLRFERGCTRLVPGAVLIELGQTRVLCTVSVAEQVPAFLRDRGQGWLTAEYGMLPGSTGAQRTEREAVRGRQSGRTLEIQRLIGRSLRAALDLQALGERTLTVDCDVLQADGGTRTAAITGAWVALNDAIALLLERGLIAVSPLRRQVAAVSVGIHQGTPILDLDYAEDSAAQTDMNLVMADDGGLIEIQGTAEGAPFTRAEHEALLDLGTGGLRRILEAQRAVLATVPGC